MKNITTKVLVLLTCSILSSFFIKAQPQGQKDTLRFIETISLDDTIKFIDSTYLDSLFTDSLNIDSLYLDSLYLDSLAKLLLEPESLTAKYESLVDSLKMNVKAPDSLRSAMLMHIEKNSTKKVQTYRLRIFFNNRQSARNESEEIELAFKEKYPDIPVVRVYDNPYWRVSVGDFQSKSSALKMQDVLKKDFPSVFLVQEAISTN